MSPTSRPPVRASRAPAVRRRSDAIAVLALLAAVISSLIAAVSFVNGRSPRVRPDDAVHTVANPSGQQPATRDAVASAAVRLRAADGTADFDAACALLATLRGHGRGRPEALDALIAQLPEQASLYRDRDRATTVLLRGAVFATLAEVGPPPSAARFVRAELATGDDPYMFGATCRVAAALGPEAAAAASIQDLLRPFGRNWMDASFSLEDPRQRQPLLNGTSARLEAVKALAALGPAARPALGVLREIAEARPAAGVAGVAGPEPSAELRQAAALAIRAIEAGPASTTAPRCCPTEANALPAWVPPSQRPDPGLHEVVVTDHDGAARQFGELVGKPTLLSFFYTRCDNLRKCSRTVTTAAELKRRIQAAGLSNETRIVLISLDPTFDDPPRLREYARLRGLQPDEQATLVRTSVDDVQAVCRRLSLPINFNGGVINLHGVGAVLLDKNGRLARTYDAVSWENEQIVGDLARLAAEE